MKPAPALAALLLAGLAAAQGPVATLSPTAWTQLGGGPGHSGVAEGLASTLDVIHSFAIAGETENLDSLFSVGSVVTPHGLASVVIDETTGVCTYVLVPDAVAGQVVRGATFPCPYAVGLLAPSGAEQIGEGTTLIGYDPANDAAVACVFARGDSPVLVSLDAATGEPRWVVTVRDLGIAVAPSDPFGSLVPAFVNGWFCEASSLDPERGRAVVGFTRTGGAHVVAAIDLDDGTVLWDRRAPAVVFTGAPVVPADVDAVEAAAEFFGTTVTRNGIVALGVEYREAIRGAAVWLTHDGDVIGGFADASDERRTFFGNWGAAERDGIVAVVIGNELLLVDPLVVEPVRIPIPIEGGLVSYNNPLAWWGDHLLVPMNTILMDYDPSGERERPPRWTWDDPAGWRIEDVLIAPPSDVYVLVSRRTEQANETALFRLDLSSGDPLQRLPLPVTRYAIPVEASLNTRSNDATFYGRLVPLGDGGIAMVTERGEVVVLGATDPALVPSIALSDGYPAIGEATTVQVEPPAGAAPVAFALSWGDGGIEDAAVGSEAAHEYAAGGLYTIRATAIYADNRTATSEAQVHVGGTPPPQLSFMQRAFAPDRAETTWGIFGLVVTLAGATVALAERRRRRGKLDEEIRVLEHVKEQARHDLPGAMRALHLFHERIQHEHAAGTLDDAQFGVLELRESRLRTQLRNRVLGAVAGRVTPRFQQALDAALEDGVLEPQEAVRLKQALAHESNLDAGERADLAALFDGWAAGEGAGARAGAQDADGAGARARAPSDADPREGGRA